MPDTPVMQPEYAERFRCTGPACEDSCCTGWSVYFDQATYQKYQAIPDGPLRVLINRNLDPQPLQADGTVPAHFAKVRLTEAKTCPFLNEEKLCRIQAEHGEEYLSVTCATYPRIAHVIDGLREHALSLSCPEAARLVLLTPNLLDHDAKREHSFRWNADAAPQDAPVPESVAELVIKPVLKPALPPAPQPAPLIAYFWPIREFVLSLLTDRAYAFWQRLFLLGVFCRRLDALARGELDRSFAAILRDFAAAVDSGSLRASMETIPADPELQLTMVLQLAGLKLTRSHVGPRFLETVEAFKTGLGYDSQATMQSLLQHYADACARYYEPFFRSHPHILENLLINTVFRTLFPFGSDASNAQASGSMFREFALIATQFALIKGLLIGVAGFHGEAFSAEHIVQTVQAASKHFEHHPQFLEQAHALLVSNGLDDLRGLTMLIRN